jgi:hypothetical protein
MSATRRPDRVAPLCIRRDQALDDHDIAPDAVEPAMLFVDADLAKAQQLQPAAAGAILDKHARDQLQKAGLLG